MRGPLLVVDVERLLRSKETGGRTRRTVGGFGIAHVDRISSIRGRLRTMLRHLVMVMSLVLAMIASAIMRTRRLLLMSNIKTDGVFLFGYLFCENSRSLYFSKVFVNMFVERVLFHISSIICFGYPELFSYS